MKKKNWDNYLNDYQKKKNLHFKISPNWAFYVKKTKNKNKQTKKHHHIVEERVSYFAIILFCLASLDPGRKSKANVKKGLRNSIFYFMKSCPLTKGYILCLPINRILTEVDEILGENWLKNKFCLFLSIYMLINMLHVYKCVCTKWHQKKKKKKMFLPLGSL